MVQPLGSSAKRPPRHLFQGLCPGLQLSQRIEDEPTEEVLSVVDGSLLLLEWGPSG